ncbi:hypothetical protein D915_007924 [Fasciola hepatica]|uniref:Uncharacterized protein n=1 Tax=Fasciola hepatica TaxID=6192 RepID=A0A4E0R0L9_FASHE|nr:hypothetical protein D915_007924 [Fasciola hepatica]
MQSFCIALIPPKNWLILPQVLPYMQSSSNTVASPSTCFMMLKLDARLCRHGRRYNRKSGPPRGYTSEDAQTEVGYYTKSARTMRTHEANHGPENTTAHSMSSGDSDSDPSLGVRKFYFPQSLMGLALGYLGVYIRAARAIPGVIWVPVLETSGPNWLGGKAVVEFVRDNEDAALIVVGGKNAKAAIQARATLKFVYLSGSPSALRGSVHRSANSQYSIGPR